MRYAHHASSEFNARLDDALRALAADVRACQGPNLVALVLGGGYGRGEGAVVRRDGIEHPYNDLDLTLVVNDRRAVDRAGLRAVALRHEHVLGIEVDFSRPVTVADIRRWPCCLMWQDLVADHVVLEGPPDLLRTHAPGSLTAPLPPIEGTRLLLNRGAGLLWAMRVQDGAEAAPDPEFVRRNAYKCALALGDALLIAHGRFTHRYRDRGARLAALLEERPQAPRVDARYGPALRFKLSPDDLPAAPPTQGELDALALEWTRVLLYVENVRSDGRWPDLEAYLRDRCLREPAQHAPALLARNFVHNLRLRRLSLRYPRERLYRWLPRLLRERRAAVWRAESEAFLGIWRRFS